MLPTNLIQNFLHFHAVLLKCLNERQEEIGHIASGFITIEEGCFFLYTCWHVVTGFDPRDIRTGNSLPNRKYLKVISQASRADDQIKDLTIIGGYSEFIIPLYEGVEGNQKPLWFQHEEETPSIALNSINLHVPATYDLVKIELPSDVIFSQFQAVPRASLLTFTLPGAQICIGNKVLIVGFPYGYSALGPEQPTAITLTRFIAGTIKHTTRLLDGFAAPGMSGAPVFTELFGQLYLMGVYVGTVNPDSGRLSSDNLRPTDLGYMNDLTLIFEGLHKMIKY